MIKFSTRQDPCCIILRCQKNLASVNYIKRQNLNRNLSSHSSHYRLNSSKKSSRFAPETLASKTIETIKKTSSRYQNSNETINLLQENKTQENMAKKPIVTQQIFHQTFKNE